MRLLATAGLGLAIAAGLALPAAAESCQTFGAGQYYDAIHFCVSSELVSKTGVRYGPENLNRDGAAWCEGARGPGIGETITIRLDGAAPFKRLWIVNGYDKSQKSFRENGRVARLKVTTDTGLRTTVSLLDQTGEQMFYLPKEAPYRWVRLTIDKVYAGERYADTCVSAVWPDFEFSDNAPWAGGK
ncbi:MAG: hypothetical protein R3D02_04860 [Hyphomicrobiales bacterium]